MTFRAFNAFEQFRRLDSKASAPDPYTQKLDLLQIDAATGEITLADGVTYTHTSDIYALDADGVYSKFGTNVPILSGARCTVAGGYVTNVYATDALGDPLDPPPQLVYQPALSNILANGISGWAVGLATTVTANQAVSSRGLLEMYSVLSTEVVGFHYAHCGNIAFTSAGVTRTVVLHAKANGTNWLQIGATSNILDANHWINFNLTTGETGNSGGGASLRGASRYLGNGIWQLAIQYTNTGTNASQFAFLITPLSSDVNARFSGGSIPGANCSVYVSAGQVYEGNTIENVMGAGSIFTSGSTLATDRTVIQAPLTAHDNDAGLWYLDADWSMPETATAQGVISVDGAEEGSVLAYTAASGFIASDDGVTTSAIAASSFVMPGSLKHCVVYSQADNKMRLFMDGALAGTEVAFDGFNLGTVVDLLLSCGYPVKINDLKSYSIESYDDGIALKDELLA